MTINIQSRQFNNDNGLTGFSGGHTIHRTSITKNHLFRAWKNFKRGKENRADVIEFAEHAEEALHILWDDIATGNYQHGTYTTFKISDSKLRTINKASVRDRIVHHMIHTELETIFDKKFIYDSYSSRKNKGVHRAVDRFEYFARKLSQNNRRTVYVLKCDIRKFFDSIDHQVLLDHIYKNISDPIVLQLMRNIVHSFHVAPDKALPLGNLTSQIGANIYLNILDQYIKRNLGIKYYIRYADDFLILSSDRMVLGEYVKYIKIFLHDRLHLALHPGKIEIRTWRQGVDVLGYVLYSSYRMIRTKTKHRIRKNILKIKYLLVQKIILQEQYDQVIASYRGRIKHCWSQELERFLGL